MWFSKVSRSKASIPELYSLAPTSEAFFKMLKGENSTPPGCHVHARDEQSTKKKTISGKKGLRPSAAGLRCQSRMFLCQSSIG